MDFIEEQDSPAAPRSVLSLGPATLPEAGKRRIGLVASGVTRILAKLFQDLEE
jgi:hypothetical protein